MFFVFSPYFKNQSNILKSNNKTWQNIKRDKLSGAFVKVGLIMTDYLNFKKYLFNDNYK